MASNKLLMLKGPATAITVAGTDVGPNSKTGVMMTVSAEYYEHKTDQDMSTVAIDLNGREVELDFELKHVTLENLLLALGLAAASLSGSSLTVDNSEIASAQMIITGLAPHSGTRTMIFDETYFTGGLEYKWSSEDHTIVPVKARVVYSPTNSRVFIAGDAA